MSSENVIRGDGDVSMEGRVNARHYDELAPHYEEQLVAWGYDAPERGAELLLKHLGSEAAEHILDCGCGTGMAGKALRDRGAKGALIGADISEISLAHAADKGVYDETRIVDLNTQLPFGDDVFDGVLCIAVLSYVEAEPVFREWIRTARPGGVVVFTCREDFFDSRDYEAILQRLEAEGGWERLEVTAPLPYLPGHEEFAEAIGVVYGCFRVM